jgi:hypothetical protein
MLSVFCWARARLEMIAGAMPATSAAEADARRNRRRELTFTTFG